MSDKDIPWTLHDRFLIIASTEYASVGEQADAMLAAVKETTQNDYYVLGDSEDELEVFGPYSKVRAEEVAEEITVDSTGDTRTTVTQTSVWTTP